MGQANGTEVTRGKQKQRLLPPKTFKLILIGNSGTGKTNFIQVWSGKRFLGYSPNKSSIQRETKRHIKDYHPSSNYLREIEASFGDVEVEIWVC